MYQNEINLLIERKNEENTAVGNTIVSNYSESYFNEYFDF